MMKLENVSKSYKTGDGEVEVLSDIDLIIPDGKFVSIIGKSGSGKSTLLNILGVLDSPTSGHVTVNGRDIMKLSSRAQTQYRSKEIGFVFQQYNLIPNLTAVENVMIALEFGEYPHAERRERAEHLLEEVGIDSSKFKRLPVKLSGGEQQRVSIARALANHPSIILADEPTGNLDTENSEAIFKLLKSLTRSEGTTVIAVTHDMDIADKTDLTYRIRDGRIDTLATKRDNTRM